VIHTTNVLKIAVDEGFCPLCLAEKIDDLSFNTFSSIEKMIEICNTKDFPEARNPYAYEESWFYVCNEHNDQDWSLEYLKGIELEFC